MRSLDLVTVFGLLEPAPVTQSDTEVQKTYSLDSFLVEVRGHAADLSCKCLRTPPYRLATADLGRLHPASGLFACPVCLNELRNARTPSDRIAVWFAQNRPSIAKDQHLYLPKTFQRLVDTDGSVVMRPRRFVYSKFFNIELQQRDKVLNTCGDPQCINPYHMMVAASSATKMTPDMKKDVQSWLTKNVSPRVIQQMLEIKYSHSFSLKTITNLRRSLPA
jgi:hypothetical protein